MTSRTRTFATIFTVVLAATLVGAGAAMPSALEILTWVDPQPEWPGRPAGIERVPTGRLVPPAAVINRQGSPRRAP